MVLRDRFVASARRAPTPVFVVRGSGAPDDVALLGLEPAIEVVQTPRQANVLLVAGEFSDDGLSALHRVHDQMSTPRTTVRWGDTPVDGLPGTTVATSDLTAVVAALIDRNRTVIADPDAGEAPILPDVEPTEWRGVGPYGQGGKGMTGGTPYGRPMTVRGPDRDLLQLDALPVTVGPWLPALPAGLSLHLVLQGDLIHEMTVNPPTVPGVRNGLFWDALDRPVPVTELELARARSHLRWLAESLRLLDLGALGARVLRLSTVLSPDAAEEIAGIEKAIRRAGVFAWSLPPGGAIGSPDPAGLGPVARAAGLVDDARLDQPAYRELGFEPIVQDGDDTAARWRVRLAEIQQSVRLAAVAGDRTAFGEGSVEGPRGRLDLDARTPSSVVVDRLPDLLAGQEWGDAVAIIAGLDLDIGEAAATPIASVEEVTAS